MENSIQRLILRDSCCAGTIVCGKLAENRQTFYKAMLRGHYSFAETQHTLGQRSKTYYTVQVPCKAYIAKYISTYYGTLRADSSSLLGQLIALSLDKKMYEKRNAWYEKKSKGLVTTVGCEINQWQFDRLGFNLPKENIMLINRYLEAHFEEELYTFCKHYTTFNPRATGKKREVGYKDAIETFARQYNISIEEDISFEGLKRKELRCRNSHEQVPDYVALPKQLELFL